MRVLLLTQHFPPQEGGIQRMLVDVVTCFDTSECIVVAPTEAITNTTNLVPQGYRIVRLPFRKLFGFLFSLIPLRWLVYRTKTQLIICGHVRQGVEALLLGKPYVVFVYAKELHQFSQSRLKRWVFGRVLTKAQRIITISEYSKSLIHSFVGEKNVDSLPPIGLLHPIAAKARPIADHEVIKLKSTYGLHNKKVIFSVSRLEERKGIDMAIKAMSLIWQQVPEALLVIASGGPYEGTLRQLAAAAATQKQGYSEDQQPIIFVGRISDEEKAAWFNVCDVYITPSRVIKQDDAEGFGIVFLEANAYGKPVVAGNSGGVPDAVVDGETGFLVNPEQVDAIAAACVRLLQDKQLAQELGANGKRRVETEFTHEEFCRKLHENL